MGVVNRDRRRFLRDALALAGFGLVAGCGMLPPTTAPATKMPRVGYLTGSNLASMAPHAEAFREGLRDLGYVEGENLVIEWRSGDGQPDPSCTLAFELARLGVDVIVTAGGDITRCAKAATSSIPIVMTNDDDPIGSGAIASLARPGGNITGLSGVSPELGAKRLEILHAIVPRLARVAVFASSSNSAYTQERNAIERAAAALGLTLQHFDIVAHEELEAAFRAAVERRSDAAVVDISGSVVSGRRGEIVELAVKHRLPAIYNRRSSVEAGGLVSYGTSLTDLHRRAAGYVDKILKGAKPAELPVEQPTTFELVVNLKTAQALGLTIPQSVLQQVTEVIP